MWRFLYRNAGTDLARVQADHQILLAQCNNMAKRIESLQEDNIRYRKALAISNPWGKVLGDEHKTRCIFCGVERVQALLDKDDPTKDHNQGCIWLDAISWRQSV